MPPSGIKPDLADNPSDPIVLVLIAAVLVLVIDRLSSLAECYNRALPLLSTSTSTKVSQNKTTRPEWAFGDAWHGDFFGGYSVMIVDVPRWGHIKAPESESRIFARAECELSVPGVRRAKEFAFRSRTAPCRACWHD